MPSVSPRSQLWTHDVENQPGPRLSADLWAEDRPLSEAASAAGARVDDLARAGRLLGSAEMDAAGNEARRDKPRLVLFDQAGRRLDEVAFNPAYHQLMQTGIELGYAADAWDGRPGGQVTHAALVYMLSQVEPGVCCPLTMTYAAVPALAADPAQEALWRPRLTARAYDPTIRPVADKGGATLGMAMTEKQGGSDLRSNSTRAERDGDAYRLTGHKWFCSAPMSDGFLTLAQAPDGLTCFLVPRWLEGERNGIRIQRLKDKMGNHANASSEIEYEQALAHRLGDEGAGVRTILEMVHHTRLDTAMAPAGLMRAALTEAHWWVTGRSAFQRKLIDQPLMRAVLADLALDWEGATALGFWVAALFERGDSDGRALARIAVALAKFLSNKRCVGVIAEAMEILGGVGYVEETRMPMLYREAPLNGIWEGSGNVICLDILRTLHREPLAGEALNAILEQAKGADAQFDAALKAHRTRWPGLPTEGEARWFAESLASLLTAAVLMQTAPSAIVSGFIATRLTAGCGFIAGATGNLDAAPLLARLEPAVR